MDYEVFIKFFSCITDAICIYYYYSYVFERKMISSKKLLTLFSIYVLVATVVVSYVENPDYLTATMFAIRFLVSFVFVASVKSRFFYCILMEIFFLLSEGFTILLLSFLTATPFPVDGEITFEFYTQGIFISQIINFCIVKIVGHYKKKQAVYISNSVFWGLLLMPASSILAIIKVVENSSTDYSFALITTVLVLASNLFVFYLFEHQIEIENKQIRLGFLEKQVLNQNKHNEELVLSRREVAKMRHDMNNQFLSLYGNLQKNDIQSAMEFVEEQLKALKKIDEVIDTANPQIDAVLSAKRWTIKDAKLDYTIPDLKTLDICAIDIAIIIATAMDNVKDAFDKLPRGMSKYASVSIKRNDPYLSIMIENTSPISDIEYNDNKIMTTKEDKLRHGFGLDTIKAIAERYDGSADFMQTDDRFISSILLKNIASNDLGQI